MKKNILLVGLGPHSKRIYINYIKKHEIDLCVLVDLSSKKEEIVNYLNDMELSKTELFLLPDKYKDDETLPATYYKKLQKACKKHGITHIICSVEPKAHNMYLKFALENNINILSDKPITVVKNMNTLESIEKVKEQYYDLVKLYENSSCSCKIMCQRQYHVGYEYVKNLLKDIISKYNIPITYIDIFHCDGNWEMPHDLEKENHPYKYGYGKLYHSGFHFIDLLAELLKLNNYTDDSKRISNGSLYGNIFTPNDEKVVFNGNDFKRIFENDKVDGIYDNLNEISYNGYGEKNFYSLMKFTNSDNRLITTADLNLLHYGFSRRGWFKSRDYYKSNGRIRHERINIEVGPLMNIQIHSYQSKEIKERKNNIEETYAGGLEHFDIDIYRNVDIIGGKPYERIKLCDLYPDQIVQNNFIGYNEYSREEFLTHFLNNDDERGDLKNFKLAIEILHSCSKVVYNNNNNIEQVEKIPIPENNKTLNI